MDWLSGEPRILHDDFVRYGLAAPLQPSTIDQLGGGAMPTTMSPAMARELAERAHADRRDKLGYEEIDHVGRVAAGVRQAEIDEGWSRFGGPGAAVAVAWLHDTVEDGLLSFRQLYHSLSPAQFEALLLLTRDGKLTYMNYMREIAKAGGHAGEIARAVKRVDLRDNMTRPCPPEMTGMREPGGRYQRALSILERGA